MNKTLILLCLGLIVGCIGYKGGTKNGIRSAVDTEGSSIVDATALGDIDMAKTTVGDFKGVIAPNYSSVSNAAMSASSSIEELSDAMAELIAYEDATNIVWNVALMTHKYIYDSRTETTYRFTAENDFLYMKAVTNVPPTAAVIIKLERGN